MNIVVYWLSPRVERPKGKLSPFARALLLDGAWGLLLILFCL